jgi:hypothetical protein
MRRNWLLRVLVCAGLVVVVQPVGAAGVTDMAAYMPAETALYVGWTQWLEREAPELREVGLWADAVTGLVRQEAGELDAAGVKCLLELLPPLLSGSVGIGLFDVRVDENGVVIDLAGVVDAGADTAQVVENVRQFIAAVGDAGEIRARTIRGVELSALPLEEGLVLYWGLHQGCCLLALSELAAGQVIDCMNGAAPTLAAEAEFKFGRAKVKAGLDGKFFCAYFDPQRVMSRAKALAVEMLGELPPTVEPLLEELGLNAYRSKYVHIHELEGAPRVAGFAHVTGPLRGLLALWQQKPLSDEDLKIVPKDAYWLQVSNCDLQAMWQEIVRVLGAIVPENVPIIEGAVGMAGAMLGFSPTEELLPVFGDTWAFFDAPDHGGLLMTGTVLVAEVKDGEALHGMLTRTVEMLAGLLVQSDVTLRQRETGHGAQRIHYVTIGGAPVPVLPAWGFAGGRCVFGLYPQTVATALQQVNPQTRGSSILDNADFQVGRKLLPREVLSIGYFDSRYFARLLYPLEVAIKAALVSLMAEYNVHMDLAILPPLPAQLVGIKNYVGAASVDGDGIAYTGVGHGGQLAAVALGAVGGATALLPQQSGYVTYEMDDEGAVSLRHIGQGCYIYANDNGDRFPETLEELVGLGLLPPGLLHASADPPGEESYIYIAGQTVYADVRNVLAYERIRGRAGTHVLFTDNHVASLSLDELRVALRATYERLDRADEMPAELR